MPYTQHPLGPPTLSGNQLTIDLFLNQPTRITRMIMDLSLQRFIADRVFASGGGVTGGAVVYDTVQANEIYAERDVERVEPGAEFPIVTSARLAPSIALVEKWGGKTFITDEAKDRNLAVAFTNEIRRITNTIIRKLNQEAVAKLDAAVTAGSRSLAGHSWSAAILYGTSPTNPQLTPGADIGATQKQAEVEELGIQYDTILVNPQEANTLRNLYGGQLAAVLADHGIRELFASNRVTAGTAYVVAAQQVGEMRIEQPLATETWRENEIQSTWVQASVRPVMFVDNNYAVIKLTGIA